MRLAFLFAPETCGPRPLDFANINDSPRGLTGTDNSFLGYAWAMAHRGHLVTIFAVNQKETTAWQQCVVRPYEERHHGIWDAVLTWNSTSALRGYPKETARIADIQVANLDCSVPDARDFVDQFVSPSRNAAARLSGMKTWGPPVAVLPNGCNMDDYPLTTQKIPGRCIYTSSPDRGLHIVFQQWPRIRAAVPHATLRVFYHMLEKWFEEIRAFKARLLWDWQREQIRRAEICKSLLPILQDQGVEYVGPVSRRQMAKEYCEAECLAYSSHPASYTETFGVAVLEGCASGAVPVLGPCDAFPELWGICPMTKGPAEQHAEEWSDMVISVLRDGYSDRPKLRSLAEEYDWWNLGKKLEDLINIVKARKS